MSQLLDTTFRDRVFLEAAKRFSKGLLTSNAKQISKLGEERLYRSMEKLYDKQLEVVQAITGGKRRVALSCTRRAGKSYLAPPFFTQLGMQATHPETTFYYIAPTLDHAKSLLWRKFEQLKMELSLDFKMKSDPWRIEFPTGAILFFRGAKDIGDLGALRGMSTKLCWVDEAQDIRSDVLRHIETSIGPSLRDFDGSMIFSGTPGPIRVGRWFEICNGFTRNWHMMQWSLFDNPHLPEKAKDLISIMDEEGFANEDDPRFLREYRAIWAEDNQKRVYHYDLIRNGADAEFTREVQEKHDWKYIIGVDWGYEDDSAAVVQAFSYTSDKIYTVAEFSQKHLTISDFIEKAVIPLRDKFKPLRIIGDAAAKQTNAEVNQRWGLGILPSDKKNSWNGKKAYVDIANSDIRKGLVKIDPAMHLAKEMSELVWEPKKLEELGQYKEHGKKANHLCDAWLYSYLHCKHWLEKAQPVRNPFVTAPQQEAAKMLDLIKQKTVSGPTDWANDEFFK